MDEASARKILGETIQEDNGLYNLGHYTAWHVDDNRITLDSVFSVEELEAIVWWIRRYQ